jgi:predicted Zn-dependent protease with MMP-like domain
MSPEQFEQAVDTALGLVPRALLRQLDNVAIFVEPECPPGQDELFGLYEGTPLTERGDAWAGSLPDRITIYQGPLERCCATPTELVRQIQVTVIHEVAHHFGIDDDQLHALGWG